MYYMSPSRCLYGYLLLTYCCACAQIPERYNHLEVVGKGSYGVVCSAIDSVRRTPVAIKKITPMAAHRYIYSNKQHNKQLLL